MVMKLLLEYQELDRKLLDKEKEYRECKEFEQFVSLQAKLKDLFQIIQKLEKETEDIFGLFEKKKQLTEIALTQNGRVMQSYDTEGNLEKLDTHEDELDKLSRTLQNADRDLTQMQRRLSTIFENYNKSYSNAIEVNKKLQVADKARSDKRNEILKCAEPIQLELKSAREKLPLAVLQMYAEVRKRKIVPAVAQYVQEYGACGACGMEVKHDIESAFNEHGLAECPHCGRILFKK